MNLNKEICRTKIPRIIHQIWIGPKNPPMHWINTVIDFCHTNGYVYKLWRDVDVDTLGLINKKAFDDEPSWAGKADILRYEILYRHGGIYIDADSMIINQDRLDLARVFDNISTECFAAYEKEGSCLIANGVMGSIKGGEFIRKIIEQINKTHSYYRSLHAPAFISFGPYCISNLYYSDNNSRLMTVLPANYFYPVHWMGVDQNKTREDIEREYPNAFMFQFGYSTNLFFKK